jgi:ASC-1-like (ASCH) protein
MTLYDFITGTKKVDVFVNMEPWSTIQVGNNIILTDNKKSYNFEVVKITYYKSVKDLLLKETLARVLPGKELEEGLDYFSQIFEKELIDKYGLIAVSCYNLSKFEQIQ